MCLTHKPKQTVARALHRSDLGKDCIEILTGPHSEATSVAANGLELKTS